MGFVKKKKKVCTMIKYFSHSMINCHKTTLYYIKVNFHVR